MISGLEKAKRTVSLDKAKRYGVSLERLTYGTVIFNGPRP